MDSENTDPDNYRFRLDKDYETQYHSALQNGYGFNLAQSLAIAMKAQNLDKKYPNLYSKIENFAQILYSKGPKTKQEAQKQLGF